MVTFALLESNSGRGLLLCRNACAGKGECLVRDILFPPPWEESQDGVSLWTSNRTPLLPIGVDESVVPPRPWPGCIQGSQKHSISPTSDDHSFLTGRDLSVKLTVMS